MAWRKRRRLLAESGYDGTPVVIMAPGDVVTLKAQPIVAAQLLRDAGFKVDLQATDWQTVVTRRASQKPPKEGGWNMFFTNWVGADVMNPIANASIGGRGTNGGWFGWAENAKIEELKDKFARSGSPDEQKKIAADIQKQAYEQVIYVPLGQYLAPSGGGNRSPASSMARRRRCSGTSTRASRARAPDAHSVIKKTRRRICSSVAFLFLVGVVSSGCPEPVPGRRSTAARGFAAAAGQAADDPRAACARSR